MLGVLLRALTILFPVLRLIFREHKFLLSLHGMLFCVLHFFLCFYLLLIFRLFSILFHAHCYQGGRGRAGLVVRASDSGSVDPGSILSRVGVLFP